MEAAIVNGDSKTGLTIMSLVREMDAGPIYYQEEFPLSGAETKPELYDVLSRRGAELLVDKLPSILDGQLPAEPQDESVATYCHLIDRQTDGVIDPTIMTAVECERRVRAYLGWPKTRLSYLGSEVIVTKARVLDNYQGDSWPDVIKCFNDTYLQVIELVAPSGKQMKTADYLRGIRS
jgi:methionyl-tRNA formyltransferase